MKKIFINQLLDYLRKTILKNDWKIDAGCENALIELIERSVEKVCKVSYEDCAKEEMHQFAKTNFSSLLAYMHINAQKRGTDCLDATSVYNALRNFNCLWPFKGKEVNAITRYREPVEAELFTWYY
jgi:hypothetical protein